MVSQMMAWEGGTVGEEVDEGYVARIQTKSCLVFQLKREEKSVRSVSKRIDEKHQKWTSV